MPLSLKLTHVICQLHVHKYKRHTSGTRQPSTAAISTRRSFLGRGRSGDRCSFSGHTESSRDEKCVPPWGRGIDSCFLLPRVFETNLQAPTRCDSLVVVKYK